MTDNKKCKYCGQILVGTGAERSKHVRWCEQNPNKYNAAKKRLRVEVVKQCIQCGKDFIVIRRQNPTTSELHKDKKEIKCCSKLCAVTYAGQKNQSAEYRVRRSLAQGGTGELKIKYTNCLLCGEQVKKNAKKYCSIEHQIIYEKEQYIKYWEAEENFSGIANARKFLLYTTGNKCSICNNTEWMEKPIPLVMDYIDGDSDNHSRTNCRLVCRNCDGLLPTFAGRNTGKGRHTKRMQDKQNRKAKGQSW